MKESLIDWTGLGDKTYEVIVFCRENRKQLQRAASERHITFDCLMAAAIVGMIRDEVEESLRES